jgi:predicted MFS family arabinose efflux permease
MNNSALTNKSRLAVLAAFFANGALTASWVSRIPLVQSRLGLSEGTLGLVLFGLTVGVVTALTLTGGLIARFGSQRTTQYGMLLMCAVLPFVALAPNPVVLVVFLFLFGCGMSSMDVSMNEQAVLLERRTGRTLMSSFHASYSIGGFAGSLIGSAMASRPNLPLLFHFLLAEVLFGGLVFLLGKYLLISDHEVPAKRNLFQLPERSLLGLGLIAFISALGEHTLTDWSGIYLNQVIETDTAFAALGYSAFSLAMTVGRLSGDYLSSKYPSALLVRLGGFTAGLGFFLSILTGNRFIVLACYALVGFGLANIIPMVFRMVGNHADVSAGAGIASVATIGYLGFLVGPPLVGFISEAFSLRMAMLVIGMLSASLLFVGKVVLMPDAHNKKKDGNDS